MWMSSQSLRLVAALRWMEIRRPNSFDLSWRAPDWMGENNTARQMLVALAGLISCSLSFSRSEPRALWQRTRDDANDERLARRARSRLVWTAAETRVRRRLSRAVCVADCATLQPKRADGSCAWRRRRRALADSPLSPALAALASDDDDDCRRWRP